EEASSWARRPGGRSRFGGLFMSIVWQGRSMAETPSIVLKLSGYRAVIEPDRWMPGSYTLLVDGTPQSHINLDDPTQLFFEYVQRIGHVIDQLPDGPITALHLGAGALSLPRYVE